MPQKRLRFLKRDLAIADYDFVVSHVRGVDGKELTLKGPTTAVLRKDAAKGLIFVGRPMIQMPVLKLIAETHLTT